MLLLTAGCALVIGLGSANSARALTTAVCEAYASEPVREGNFVTSIHAISCSTYVSSISIVTSLSGPGGEVRELRRCIKCASISLKLSVPYSSGNWTAYTSSFGIPWGDDNESTVVFIP